MTSLGFEILGHKESAICPVLLRDEKKAHEFAEALLKKGIYVIAFSYPVVAKGLARIRVQLSASHTPNDVSSCLRAFKKIGKQLKIIK